MKHKVINNTYDKEIVKMNGVEMTMRKALSAVEVNNEVIFQAIEQGHEHKIKDIFFRYHPEYKQLT